MDAAFRLFYTKMNSGTSKVFCVENDMRVIYRVFARVSSRMRVWPDTMTVQIRFIIQLIS